MMCSSFFGWIYQSPVHGWTSTTDNWFWIWQINVYDNGFHPFLSPFVGTCISGVCRQASILFDLSITQMTEFCPYACIVW